LAATQKPPENKFVHNIITKKSVNQLNFWQFLQPIPFHTISSTDWMSQNFFKTQFLLTNSKAQFYTFFNKFKTWISSLCIFHLQMC
jgi:hypothetical protein